jgi:signal transduction histidine kinase
MHRAFFLLFPVWRSPEHHAHCCRSTWTPGPASFTSAILLWTPLIASWWPWVLVFGILVAAGIVIARRACTSLRREVMAHRAFLGELIESQDRERREIAAVLRENIGRRLLAVRRHAVRHMTSGSVEKPAHPDEISSLVGEAISTLRRTALDLHPHRLDTRGVTEAIRSLVLRQSTVISFAIDIESIDGILPPGHEINLYRIVEESINNIIRHSGATTAHIIVRRDPTLIHVTIQDNGRGLVSGEHLTAGSFRATSGLLVMTERARLIGGMVTVDSPGSAGTIVTVTVPR